MSNVTDKPISTLKLVKDFFGLSLTQMKAEWSTLPDADKRDIEKGLRDGTLTY